MIVGASERYGLPFGLSWLFLSASSALSFQKIRSFDDEDACQAVDHVDHCRILAPFQRTDVVSMDVHPVREFVL